MIKFVTLGPAGSNHEFVTERYLAFHGLKGRATIDFFRTFDEGAHQVLNHQADYMIQCAVHPETVSTVDKYMQGLYVVDTFISHSQHLAIVRNKAVANPRTLAVMDPTKGYTDVSKWDSLVSMSTVVAVGEALREGIHDVGLTYTYVAEREPDRFVIDEFIGSVDDAWIVYGRTRVTDGSLLAWPDSPAASLFREQLAEGGGRD